MALISAISSIDMFLLRTSEETAIFLPENDGLEMADVPFSLV